MTPLDAEPRDELQEALLRSAYRLDPTAHPDVHAAATRAAAALGVTVPVVIYQFEGSDGANAELIFRPGEAIVAFSGNTLGLLHGDELTAAFGHELAHHRLWSADDGRILTADRLLGAMTMDAVTPPMYYETARRYDLATELYADRGARLACGNLGASIRSLVKVATGLAEVDDVAYLAQAEAANPRAGSRGLSHPETVLRAWVLARWDPDTDAEGDTASAAVTTLLQPALDLDHLDLVDAERLAAVTRTLVMESLAAGEWLRTEPVVGHARQFFADDASASGQPLQFPDGLAVTPIPAEASPRPAAISRTSCSTSRRSTPTTTTPRSSSSWRWPGWPVSGPRSRVSSARNSASASEPSGGSLRAPPPGSASALNRQRRPRRDGAATHRLRPRARAASGPTTCSR